MHLPVELAHHVMTARSFSLPAPTCQVHCAAELPSRHHIAAAFQGLTSDLQRACA